ncbi:S-adenosyl-L-methionine-dependent methyltransferase [Polychaeton citri CBS 116435]|uniref:S-adenosyl-L-methionine-dependent methyltransferase n=1 Tax=Polychaeton citri CBS 116435 TaxID=1314669 RepID=A0A9P4Q8V7_9PEZI|nr:S-adenosyl-L-methionine-dependent methyltransferase [Polychaeton citri CBS 116435]
MSTRNQAQDAQALYDGRATRYDDSWHARFTRHMAEMLSLRPGQHVLDLACGTGLMTYRESTAVGPDGSVIGVDISSGMLSEAESKRHAHEPHNVHFYRHSITELMSLEALAGKTFDAITCVSALVLLPDPEKEVGKWVSLLKPGGRFMVDRPDDLRQLLERAGLVEVDIQLVSQKGSHSGTDDLPGFLCDYGDPCIENAYKAADGEALFRSKEGDPFTRGLFEADTKDLAVGLFNQEWGKLADADGSVLEVDGVFVAVGKRPT